MANLFDRTSNTAASDLSGAFTVGLNNPEKATEFRKVTILDLATWAGTNSSVAAVIGTPASGFADGSIRIAGAIGGGFTVPGDSRGSGAVDLQIIREDASQIASGEASTLAGGANNKATGLQSVVVGGISNVAAGIISVIVGGSANEASGQYSAIVGGTGAKAVLFGQEARASGTFATAGDCQIFSLTAFRSTSNSTPANVFLDGGSERLSIASGYAWAFTVSAFGISSDGTVAGHYIRKGMIANIGGTTALIGSVTTVGTDTETDAGLDVTITADNTNDALGIQVTGLLATNMRWIARVEALQLKLTT